MDEINRPSAPEPTQAFSPPARPAPEPTQAIPPQPTAPDTLTDVEKRHRIEAEMTKLGLSPDEVRRLLNANAHTADTAPSPLPKPTLIPPTGPGALPTAKKGSDRVTADSLAAFAAQLKAQKDAERQVSITTAGRSLPEFRESSVQEVRAAEALLRDANMLRRREKFVDAEAKCREALEMTPKDGSALEMLGDILQGVARIDEALAAYKRALEADPRRTSAEKKYADLLMRQESWAGYDPEAAPPNVRFSVLLSLCLPGAGQFFYGSYVKGAVFLVLDVIVGYLLFFSSLGVADKHKHSGISVSLIALLSFTVVLYVAAIADTIAESKRAD
ncbi:MAG: Tetratricopeptide repeat [Chthonomonadaceae bacterium]|jgi:tetratricopeptide (TPR) repeat protein|nr:Tetratricopeptide repeat [Chthonomonadaceae bacterium]